MGGQVYSKRRAPAGFAVYVDEPVILFDDAVDGGQAQPGALAGSLVVKNGSKICPMVSLSMPQPSSLTANITKSPGINPACSAQ